MKHRLFVSSVIAAIALMSGAGAASAVGTKLAWQNCYGGGGAHVRTFACNVNTGNNTLVASVDAPSGIDLWTAFEATIIFDFGGIQPAWWQLRNQGTQTGQCRNGALSTNAISAGLTGCEDVYGGNGSGGIGTYLNDSPTPGKARLLLVFAIPAGNELPLTPDTEYFVSNVVITNTKSTSTGSCAGCDQGVCAVLSNVKCVQPAGAPGGDVVVSNPSNPGTVGTEAPSNTAAWQNGDAICIATPTRRTTWGSVKSLYR